MPAPRATPLRIRAAAVFGAAGAVFSLVIFFPLIIRGAIGTGLLLFVVCPAIAGAGGGAVVGRALLAAPRAGAAVRAAFIGAGAGLVAMALFAPLYALGIVTTEPGWSGIAGLTLLTFEMELLAFGLPILGVSAGVGWLLYRRALRRSASPG